MTSSAPYRGSTAPPPSTYVYRPASPLAMAALFVAQGVTAVGYGIETFQSTGAVDFKGRYGILLLGLLASALVSVGYLAGIRVRMRFDAAAGTLRIERGVYFWTRSTETIPLEELRAFEVDEEPGPNRSTLYKVVVVLADGRRLDPLKRPASRRSYCVRVAEGMTRAFERATGRGLLVARVGELARPEDGVLALAADDQVLVEEPGAAEAVVQERGGHR